MINVSSSVTDYLNRKKSQLAGDVSQATGKPVTAMPNTLAEAGMKTAAPEQPKPFESVAGTNVQNYVNRTSSTLGQDPGYTTEAGALAAKRTTDALKTPDAQSVNAQNTQDTAAARRAYLARVQSEEAIGQSGFGTGTAQADRIRMNSQAGVDEANQTGQNSVNAYIRQRTEDNLNRAQGLEKDQYGKMRDTLGDAERLDLNLYGRSEKATDRGLQAAATAYQHSQDAIQNSHWDTTNQQQQAQQGVINARNDKLDAANEKQQTFENAQVLKGSDETAKRNLLSSLPEGPAKNKVMAGLANGTLTLQNALDSVFDTSGAIKPEYQGKTPGALGLDAEREYAQQTVDLEDPTLKTTDPQKYLARVNEEMLKNRNAKNSPVNAATTEAKKTDIVAKLNTGGTLTPDEETEAIKTGAIPTLSADHVPTGGDKLDAFTEQNPSGKFAVGGTVYTIQENGKTRTGWEEDWMGYEHPRHTEYVTATDSKGNTKYFYDGAMHDAPPKSV